MIGIYKVKNLIPKGKSSTLNYFRYDFYHRRLVIMEQLTDHWPMYAKITDDFKTAIFDGLRDKWWEKYKEDFEMKRSSGYFLKTKENEYDPDSKNYDYWREAIRDPRVRHDKPK